jgi:ATP-dependent Clp protease ATP-binding subunit ClpA
MGELIKSIRSSEIRSRPDFKRISPDGSVLEKYCSQLQETVFGQERACREVAEALTRALAGFHSPKHPLFTGIFLGGPGCGKTEMGKGIVQVIAPHSPADHLQTIDCSNFSDSHDIHRFTGAPPSYVGFGQNPLIPPRFLEDNNVIVFDEIEKAHPAFHQMLLSVMDRGKLQTSVEVGDGRSEYQDLDFSKSIILMTSNVGSSEIVESLSKRKLGFIHESGNRDSVQQLGLTALAERWRQMPEFLNRLDGIVVFEPLTRPVYEKIFDKFLTEFNWCLEDKGMLMITEELKQWLIDHFDENEGGRGLYHAMEKYLVTPAAGIKLQLPDNSIIIEDLNPESGSIDFFTLDNHHLVPLITVLQSRSRNVSDFQI